MENDSNGPSPGDAEPAAPGKGDTGPRANERILSNDLKRNVKETATWLRFLFMLLFAAIVCLTSLVLGAIVLFQFMTKLLTGDVNKNVLAFGQDLSTYVYDVLRYLTFNSDERPFPFGKWKSSSAE